MPHVIISGSRKWMCFISPPIISAGVNHATPRRACAAVLKLSIVFAAMSLAFLGRPTGGPRAEGITVQKDCAEGNCASARISPVCIATAADSVSLPPDKATENVAKWH